MAPLTFSQALTQAEAQARSTLAPELQARLRDAVQLVTDGRVFQATDGTWQVDSATREGLVHHVNGACSCEDAHFQAPQGLCKHRIAVYVSRRAAQLMEHPGGISSSDTTPKGVSNTDTLPEAPASANCHIMIAGRQVQLTLRDTDEARLLERLAVVLQQYPLPQPVPQAASQPQGQGKAWCQTHQTTMQENHKDGRSWYSHKTADGQWCKGR